MLVWLQRFKIEYEKREPLFPNVYVKLEWLYFFTVSVLCQSNPTESSFQKYLRDADKNCLQDGLKVDQNIN